MTQALLGYAEVEEQLASKEEAMALAQQRAAWALEEQPAKRTTQDSAAASCMLP